MRLKVGLGVVCFVATLLVAGAEGAPPAAVTQAINLDSDPHLVGWWKLGETAGQTAADSSAQKHDGTLEGGLSFDTHSVAGRSGRALKFNGGESSLRIAGFKGIAGTRPRTVAAWIKTASASGEIVSWGRNEHGQMWIFGHTRGGLGVTPGGGYLYMKPGHADNAWHHVAAVVRDAALPNLHDDVKLYKDGEPAEIDDIGLLDLWPIETGQMLDVRIGQRWAGLISDLRIYDRGLSDEEIKALFSAPCRGPAAKP
ncbi:MAG: LamG domain-containing protein [Thermoguttaceae bacterium]|jgi:hypothetical protein